MEVVADGVLVLGAEVQAIHALPEEWSLSLLLLLVVFRPFWCILWLLLLLLHLLLILHQNFEDLVMVVAAWGPVHGLELSKL